MFTMVEYIEKNQLGINPRDTKGLKMVAAHLRKLGYEQTRSRVDGKQKIIWMRKNRAVELEALSSKLEALEKKESKK